MLRVLALIPGGIGDQILFLPTLDDLKRSYPQAMIDVMVEPRAKGAYRVSQIVQDVRTFNFGGRNGPADWGNFIGLVREREYNAVLYPRWGWPAGLLLWLMGVPKRVGYASGADWFLTNPVPLKDDQYRAIAYHDLLQGFGISTPCPEIAINVPKKDLEWAEVERQRLQLSLEQGYVLIYGGSDQGPLEQAQGGIYPAASWQAILQDFQQRQPDLPVVAIQGPEDRGWLQPLLALCPGLKVTTPADIGKLAAMIAGANLLLCTESTPMHLAVAVKTYMVTLLGAGHPQQLLPQSDRLISLQSPTGQVSDLAPATVLAKVWGG